MDQKVIIDALVQVARKRRLLGLGPSQRLGEYAQQKNIQNLDDLRRWLAAGDGLSAHLANQLLTFVPREDVKPLGPYIPLAHLADGGMGSVWLSCSPKNELVVVKTLKASLPQGGLDKSQGTEFMRRFEREARITQQLTHPNIVRCLDSGVSDDRVPYMVLEYVDSGDLKDLVERRGGLNEGLALAILYQVADGLAEANRIHLVHRDIKPPNIFVSSDGRAKLADFGIARSTESNRTMLTMEGAIVGSPLYMSPEQIVTDPNLDVRSDIYALGAVLYYCLAATAPFDGRLQEVLHKHCTASVPDIRKLRPIISESSAQIIFTCMQKERGKRFKDPAELRAAIANALVKLGLTPGAPIEEDTRQGDLSSEASDIFKSPDANAQTIATDLRGDQSNQNTIAADLRGDAANMQTIAADLRGDSANMQTIASNLLEADPAPAMSAADIHTIAANFLSDDAEAVPSNIPATTRVTNDGSTQATVPMVVGATTQTLSTAVTGNGLKFTPPKVPDKFSGDLATAIAADWISLLPPTPGEPSAILLFARTRACLGKLREPPVDICLRNYPVSVHKEACQRVSRQHLNISYDSLENRCVIEDLNSPNGTMLDGITIKPGQSAPLASGAENILLVANVMSLWVHCLPRRRERQRDLDGAPPSDGTSPCGIDAKHGFDSVIITRPENRPELAYALVLRQISVGGPGADLVCAGARTRSAVQLALFSGRWIWRPAGSEDAWKPLCAGAELDCGGKRFVVQPGAFTNF